MRIVRPSALLALPLLAFSGLTLNTASAQAPSPYTSVQGTITKVDLAAKTISVKTETGDTTVKYSDLTKLNELPPGEADTKKATPLKAEDMSPGDHILARVQTKNPTGLPAGSIYVNRASDIAKENAAKAQEWQTQVVSGTAASVNEAGKKIVMSVKGANGQPDREVALDLSGPVNYQRLSDLNFTYERTDGSGIKAGDRLRVLGTKNADVTQIKVTDLADDLAIKQIGATVKTVDPATGTITATDTSKKPVTITVRTATKVKRLDDPTAQMIARIVNPTMANTRGGRGGGGGGRGAGPEGEAGGGGRGFGGQAGGGAFGGSGGRGRGARGSAGQIQNLIDQQPNANLSDLKPGEEIIISGPASPDASSISAMMVLAGVDPILRAAPNNGVDPLGSGWSNVGGGGGGE